MKHQRLTKLQEIGPTAIELGFEIYEAKLIDSGETAPPTVLSERIATDDAMRARAEGIIKSLRSAADPQGEAIGGGDAPENKAE